MPAARPLLPVVAVALPALVLLAQSGSVLLWALPAIVLLAALALGRYPGERVLLTRRRARPPRPVAPRALGSAGRAPHSLGPSGAALLAFKRAVRPPPAALVTG